MAFSHLSVSPDRPGCEPAPVALEKEEAQALLRISKPYRLAPGGQVFEKHFDWIHGDHTYLVPK